MQARKALDEGKHLPLPGAERLIIFKRGGRDHEGTTIRMYGSVEGPYSSGQALFPRVAPNQLNLPCVFVSP